MSLPEPAPPDTLRDGVLLRVPGPVDEEGPALDLVALDEAPVAAVLAVVPVVAHHEVGVRRHLHRRALADAEALLPLPPRVVDRAAARLRGLAVHVDLLVLDVEVLAADRDDPLDEVARLVHRVLEDDDVAPLRSREPVDELVDQDVVAHQEGRDHRAGGDLERLDDERPDEQREQHRDEDRLGVLAEDGLLPHLDDLPRDILRRRVVDRLCHRGAPQDRRTERKASWGISTRPICFIRFLPSFWRSRSLRFRVMSPP